MKGYCDIVTNIRLPKYSIVEEIINSISHGLGAVFGIVGLILLIVSSSHHQSILSIITSSIYGGSLIFLYIISCIYHALSSNLKAKKIFRIIDHCGVYLLVAGTYTPIALVGLNGIYGWIIFSLVWIVTILGIVLTCINVDKYQIASVTCHLLAGWSILFVLEPLVVNVGNVGITLLLVGGLCYSLGSVLYLIGSKVSYMHCVFHFFVLAGSILHFITIYCYVI